MIYLVYSPTPTPTLMYVFMNESLVHDEDEVDDDIEEGLMPET